MDKNIHILPCGAEAYLEEGMSLRCMTCLSIYGSCSCACSNKQEKQND